MLKEVNVCMKIIYKIACDINNKIYIGQTKRYEIRKREHVNDLKANRHANRYLQEDYNKYGLSHFKFDIIEQVEDKVSDAREDYWMDFYGGIDSVYLYNSTNSYTKSIFMKNKLHNFYAGKSHIELHGEQKAAEMRKLNSEKHMGKKPGYVPFKGKVKTTDNKMILITEDLYKEVKRLRSLGYTYQKISDITSIKCCGIRNIVLDTIHLPFKCND